MALAIIAPHTAFLSLLTILRTKKFSKRKKSWPNVLAARGMDDLTYTFAVTMFHGH
jgi:hypothetical protein